MSFEKRNNDKKKNMRALAVFLIVIFLVNTILSLLYTSMEANHHCNHENCPICETILICEKSVRNLCAFLAVVIVVYLFAILVDLISGKEKSLFIRMTLVKQGIRLND